MCIKVESKRKCVNLSRRKCIWGKLETKKIHEKCEEPGLDIGRVQVIPRF